MSIFFFDDFLEVCEKHREFSLALEYLEKKYVREKDNSVLCSLIGFSWFYFVEGPCIVGFDKIEKTNVGQKSLDIWKKYIDIGIIEKNNSQNFNFISGYTLTLHGFFITAQYECLGIDLMRKCSLQKQNELLYQLANNFLLNLNGTTYTLIENRQNICETLFDGKSLIDKYFREIYRP